jgi:hypothetical protein
VTGASPPPGGGMQEYLELRGLISMLNSILNLAYTGSTASRSASPRSRPAVPVWARRRAVYV